MSGVKRSALHATITLSVFLLLQENTQSWSSVKGAPAAMRHNAILGNAYPVVYTRKVRRRPSQFPDDQYMEEILETFNFRFGPPVLPPPYIDDEDDDEEIDRMIRCDFDPTLKECELLRKPLKRRHGRPKTTKPSKYSGSSTRKAHEYDYNGASTTEATTTIRHTTEIRKTPTTLTNLPTTSTTTTTPSATTSTKNPSPNLSTTTEYLPFLPEIPDLEEEDSTSTTTEPEVTTSIDEPDYDKESSVVGDIDKDPDEAYDEETENIDNYIESGEDF